MKMACAHGVAWEDECKPCYRRGDDGTTAAYVKGYFSGLYDGEVGRRYRVYVRTPDDPDGWTAIGEGKVGDRYQYVSGDVAVIVEWDTEGAPRPKPTADKTTSERDYSIPPKR